MIHEESFRYAELSVAAKLCSRGGLSKICQQ